MARKHPIAKAVGLSLRELREAKDFTQEKLAHAAGVDRTFIGMIERNERHVTLNTIAYVLDALEVSWAEFGARLDKHRKHK